MKNLKFETLRETVKGEKYYVLFKVSLENSSGYCIAVKDNDFAVGGIGNDTYKATEIYDMLSCGEVSAIHTDDVIKDLKSEIFV